MTLCHYICHGDSRLTEARKATLFENVALLIEVPSPLPQAKSGARNQMRAKSDDTMAAPLG